MERNGVSPTSSNRRILKTKVIAIFFALVIPAISLGQDLDVFAKALQAARNAKTNDQIKAALLDVVSREAEDGDDLAAIFEAVKLLDARKLEAAQDPELRRMRESLTQNVARCTAPRHHQVIMNLLEAEAAEIPTKLWLAGQATPGLRLREESRFTRLQALTKAAGEGKNQNALPVLRKITGAHTNTAYSDIAIAAIGQIGDPADLAALIEQAKANPKRRLYLKSFGAALIDPVMKELNSGNLSDEQRGKLHNILSQARTRDAIPRYRLLLSHNDPTGVRVAAQSIGDLAGSSDNELLLEMLKNRDRYVRFAAVMAIGHQAWDVQYADELIEVLKSDGDEGVRVMAMKALAEHGVSKAKPVIEAMRVDPSRRVRDRAAHFSK